MRVIAGEFRSRRLKTLPGMALRPTPDRLRESLFNVLAPRIAGCVFVDAYAGSGAVGIEALSRGAARAVFVEKHPAAVRVIRENLAALGIEDRAQVFQASAAMIVRRYREGIVFLDPPYPLVKEYDAALRALGAAPGPSLLVIAQHSSKQYMVESAGGLKRVRQVRQGDNTLSFYEAE
ncbi:MAG: 16S rRNA (guanine(966)-N(2))-methyltransferase RsmD [Acidobacteriales bacterium]|nr:16S rRNA (guanine(966)-N(2))-methyltransferase RsmD [Terriglobales bacterium]